VTAPTPLKAWQEMQRGNARFVAGEPRHPRQDVERRAELAMGQRPRAALFGCSDSRLSAEIIFDKGLGGPASARLTILRPGKTLYSRVVSQSPIRALAPYFGQTVQFPLGRSLNVKKGYVIALTVPTWAPALTPLLTDHSSWRASRPKGKCDDAGTQTAQSALKKVAQYRCLYKARLTYSATLVTRPVPNPGQTGGK